MSTHSATPPLGDRRRRRRVMLRQVPVYRLHDTVGDFRGLLEHPAADVEPGAVVHLSGGREAIVTARAETNSDRVRAQALLEVLVATTMPPIPHLTS